jgi:hypothetical protein
MTVSAMLKREIETLPEVSAMEALDFIIFLKNRPFEISRTMPVEEGEVKSMFGAFPGINTNIEREEDRV